MPQSGCDKHHKKRITGIRFVWISGLVRGTVQGRTGPDRTGPKKDKVGGGKKHNRTSIGCPCPSIQYFSLTFHHIYDHKKVK